MWIQRIGGAILAMTGAILLGALAAALYTPFPDAQPMLNLVGMPGFLLGDMFGLLALMTGLWLMLAPMHAARHIRRLGGRKPED